MTKKIKVVHIPRMYPNSRNPQASIFFKEQAEAVVSCGVDVSVLSIISQPLASKIFFQKFKLWFKKVNRKGKVHLIQRYLITLPLPYRIKLYYKCWVGYRMLKDYIKHYGMPDLIHLQTYEMGLIALRAKKKLGIKYVVTEHMSTFYVKELHCWYHNMVKNTYQSSERNIAVSRLFKEKLESLFHVNFDVIPNVVDTAFFTPVNNRIANSKFYFINVAYLVHNKNQRLLIEAFNLAFSTNPYIYLKICGNGPELQNLEQLVQTLSLENRVFLTGKLTKEQVRAEMQSSDAFVLSSTVETFGVVVIEAMACGLPCISTRSRGPEDIITNESLGELCSSNIEELAEMLLKVYNSSYDHNKIRQHTIDNYSVKTVGESIVKVYNEVI